MNLPIPYKSIEKKKRIKILKGLHIGKRVIKWSKKREYYSVIVLAIDFLYFRNKQPILYKQFKKIPKQKKKRMDVLCIIYIVSIIVVNTLFTIYFRSKNAG